MQSKITSKPNRAAALGGTVYPAGEKLAELLSGSQCYLPIFSFNAELVSPSTFQFSLSPPIDSTISHYLWDFGDSTSSILASPTKTYSSAGTYRVILECTNHCGSTKAKRTLVISLDTNFLLFENDDFILSENGVDLFIQE